MFVCFAVVVVVVSKIVVVIFFTAYILLIIFWEVHRTISERVHNHAIVARTTTAATDAAASWGASVEVCTRRYWTKPEITAAVGNRR